MREPRTADGQSPILFEGDTTNDMVQVAEDEHYGAQRERRMVQTVEGEHHGAQREQRPRGHKIWRLRRRRWRRIRAGRADAAAPSFVGYFFTSRLR